MYSLIVLVEGDEEIEGEMFCAFLLTIKNYKTNCKAFLKSLRVAMFKEMEVEMVRANVVEERNQQWHVHDPNMT